MELYTKVSYAISQRITLDYSTSFGTSSRLFSPEIRAHIYAIYGLVRIADEVVDVYRGEDAAAVLSELEREVYESMHRGYSVNPVVHSFALTANRYGISKELIAPFFASMAMDLSPREYTDEQYETYIYGSAEVIGLMCLRVFLTGDDAEYERLADGARALGSAYQKVNFLRDLAADYSELGRVYFPGVSFESFDETTKMNIIADIKHDITRAKEALVQLPDSSRKAVSLSVLYYEELLHTLERTSAVVIKKERIRVSNLRKLVLYIQAVLGGKSS